MPVTYHIDIRNRTIRTKCFGNVALSDVIDHFRTLQQDPQCPARLDVFLDLSEADTLPDSREIMAVATELKRVRSKVRFDACAIWVTTDALYGMMRVFEAHAEQFFRITRIFRVANEAQTWLTAQHPLSEPTRPMDS